MDLDAIRRKHADFFPCRFGFECQDGWAALLDRMLTELSAILPLQCDFKFVRVKEKFGALRTYYRVEPKLPADLVWDVYRIIARAEARSMHTCEQCGRPGRLRVRCGFYFTSCDAHTDEDGGEHSGRRAEPVEEPGSYYERFEDERVWHRYDPDVDDFVPSDPPEGFKGR